MSHKKYCAILRILAGNHKANPRFWREFKLNGVSDNKRTEDNKKGKKKLLPAQEKVEKRLYGKAYHLLQDSSAHVKSR